MTTPYVKQTWTDGLSAASAARMAFMEQGIFDAQFPPCARVYNSGGNQAIPTATFTAVTFDSERFDTDTIHDTGSNTSRLTAKTAGKYQITGSINFQVVAAGTYRQARIRLNGITYIASVIGPPDSGGDGDISITTLWDMAVNDYVELMVAHDRGSNLNVLASSAFSPEFMMVRVA